MDAAKHLVLACRMSERFAGCSKGTCQFVRSWFAHGAVPMIPWLERDDPFPPLASALKHPNGLLAAGGDLSPARLLAAYRQGIFPWYSRRRADPVVEPGPAHGAVSVRIEDLALARQDPAQPPLRGPLRHRLRGGDARLRPAAPTGRARRGQPAPGSPTTCTPPICACTNSATRTAAETWIDGELAGGLYGVAIGRMFYGESMFTRARDASKIALAHLVRRLAAPGLRHDRLPDEHRASRQPRRARDPAQRIFTAAAGIGRLCA